MMTMIRAQIAQPEDPAEQPARYPLRANPAMVIRPRKTREPFKTSLRVTEPLDVLELIGRREPDAPPEPTADRG